MFNRFVWERETKDFVVVARGKVDRIGMMQHGIYLFSYLLFVAVELLKL
jgi:hypothetical protein